MAVDFDGGQCCWDRAAQGCCGPSGAPDTAHRVESGAWVADKSEAEAKASAECRERTCRDGPVLAPRDGAYSYVGNPQFLAGLSDS